MLGQEFIRGAGPDLRQCHEQRPQRAKLLLLQRRKPECKSGRDSFHCDALSQIWFVVLAICGEEILSVFYLSCGALEPVFVMRWAEAGIIARNEALIVHLYAEVARFVVGDHLPRVARRT